MSQKPRAFGSESLPVIYQGQKKAWITKDIFKNWFYTCFVPEVRKKMQQLNLDSKAILVVDNASGHPEDICSDDKKIILFFLPPNVTPLVQPMDQNVIQAIKLHYRKALLKRIVTCENTDIAAELKKINLNDVMFELSKAWENVKPELIKNSWTKLLGQVNDDWDEDDDLPLAQWKNKMELGNIDKEIEEVNILINQIVSEDVTRQEVVEWVAGREESCDYNDMEILRHVESENSRTSDEEVDATKEMLQGVKHVDAVKCFETCLKWTQENDESENHIILLCEMKKRVEKAEKANIKQSKIIKFFIPSF
ncbi:jerky protein homolog-like [Euwallacea similis]|uniref:jerky protein homolog-like n=1 Tax=Euwallacea similis TaxID=1736056 RepID=UPI00344E081C